MTTKTMRPIDGRMNVSTVWRVAQVCHKAVTASDFSAYYANGNVRRGLDASRSTCTILTISDCTTW